MFFGFSAHLQRVYFHLFESFTLTLFFLSFVLLPSGAATANHLPPSKYLLLFIIFSHTN